MASAFRSVVAPARASGAVPAAAGIRDGAVELHHAGACRELNESRVRPELGRVFVALDGKVKEDRSLLSAPAIEQRYRKLIHHLPFALLQVDTGPVEKMFDRLRADGVTDIAAYLDQHPDLIETARDIVRVTDATRSAALLLGATEPADLTRPVAYLYAAAPETARRVMIAHFEGRRSHAEIMKLRTFDGRLLDVRLSVTYPALPEQPDVTLMCLEDVTERLRTEAQLRQLQADYARAARLSTLGELTTSIAHEVNQPLSAIVTNAETSLRWLSRDDPNLAKVGQLATRIAESARRASSIVRRIREMAARQPPERLLIDLNEVVDEALSFVRHDIESRAIDLSVNLAPDLARIAGDRVQLQQVIVNLLVNSLQAIDQAGGAVRRIELATQARDDGGVEFSIHDSGPGIVEQDLDQVFNSFFTTKEQGVGIGLAICQSIITAHGGAIVVSNHPDGGAHFRFSLPAGLAMPCG